MNFLEKVILCKEIMFLGHTALCVALIAYIWRQVTIKNTERKEQFFELEKNSRKKVCFDDVAGCDEAKQEIIEIVEFLKNPKKYENFGAKIHKGVLLVGPPGTGKTLLAKAIAGESGVSFLSISGSDFVQYVGAGPSRMRSLFSEAKNCAPSVIFIDEIDTIGRAPTCLNQLLVEMDGFGSTNGVVVLAGTNMPDMLDKALLGPGRFDFQISIDTPDIRGRDQIFRIHLKAVKLDPKATNLAQKLAVLTPGFTGADIAKVCNEAALIAARTDSEWVTMDHFESAMDRIFFGPEKPNKVISKQDRRTVAYHESGHTVTAWFLEHIEPVRKVTIVPHGSALGYTERVPSENRIMTEKQFFDIACVTLGGRASEQIMLGEISTGSRDDLEKLTEMTYELVSRDGFSDKVGILSFPPGNKGSDGTQPYSSTRKATIDAEVKKWVQKAYDHTLQIIKDHKEHVDQIAKQLLEKEVLYGEDLIKVLGERPWKSTEQTNYDRFKHSFIEEGAID
ncbi:hypothetical protein AQUCO_00900948v1 [Aquilegia coerulea]|uniref:AAA+ ATPase domain-containing protein n=1 Tax=Aquilegia coerulea TaxID=218851 RepID=A0A2G5EG39_AQUCA|nr:hypothetical protein AQUCO_00900948v1 [Aquilegia coerulea]